MPGRIISVISGQNERKTSIEFAIELYRNDRQIIQINITFMCPTHTHTHALRLNVSIIKIIEDHFALFIFFSIVFLVCYFFLSFLSHLSHFASFFLSFPFILIPGLDQLYSACMFLFVMPQFAYHFNYMPK